MSSRLPGGLDFLTSGHAVGRPVRANLPTPPGKTRRPPVRWAGNHTGDGPRRWVAPTRQQPILDKDAFRDESAPMEQTPPQLGYRMPAEWEPHAATWIAWPHNRDDWPGKFAPIPWVYTEIVRHLSRVEKVHIVVRGGTMKRRVSDQLDSVGVNLDAVGSSRPRPTASGSATRARRSSSRTSQRPSARDRRRSGRLEVQRLGQVRQPPPRRSPPSQV